MKRSILSFWVVACLFLTVPGLHGGKPGDLSRGTAVLAGKLLTLDDDDRVINQAVVLMRDGRFEALGPADEVPIPEGYEVIDARDRWVVPGLVDYHSHVGGSLSDLNDGVYLTNPGLRVDECLKPDNEHIRDAAAAGITTMLVIPGSGNNLAGFGIMFKTGARSPDEAILANPGCLKMAQAGNPEWYWYGVGRSFMNWNLRSTLEACKDYHDAWCAYEQGAVAEEPEFHPAYEPFRDVFRGKMPTCMHTQAYQVCLATFVMMHDLFGFWTVPTHSSFDAYKLAPLARDREIVIIAGPRNLFLDGADRRINGLAAKWAEGGEGEIVLGTETDAPVLPIEEHAYQASLACRLGWDSYEALKGLCRATAKGAMLDDRVGSVVAGKDADLGIWSGDPIDPRSHCVMTLVNGRVVYRMEEGRRY